MPSQAHVTILQVIAQPVYAITFMRNAQEPALKLMELLKVRQLSLSRVQSGHHASENNIMPVRTTSCQ